MNRIYLVVGFYEDGSCPMSAFTLELDARKERARLEGIKYFGYDDFYVEEVVLDEDKASD